MDIPLFYIPETIFYWYELYIKHSFCQAKFYIEIKSQNYLIIVIDK
ncbi:hypothetical protein HMPREF1992_01863 [Selenomonas sp. oral taxon 892 str. F0426]|nr:hypothetical protein HMPREF1992_01863 [Selenomonas sp. oral taxon 892 str. F0426]